MNPTSKIEPAKPLLVPSQKKPQAAVTKLVPKGRPPSAKLAESVKRLPPELRSTYEALYALVDKHAQLLLFYYYEVGLHIKRLFDDEHVLHPTRRRSTKIEMLADALNVSSRTLYDSKKLVDAFTPEQYIDLISRQPISWAHVCHLLQVSSVKRRQELIERVVAENWSADELGYEIADISKKKPRGPGRDPKPPRNIAQGLHKTIHLSKSYYNVVFKALLSDAFDLPTQIQDLAPDKVTSEMRQQIEQAVAALQKVQTIAEESARHLLASLKQPANVIDVNCVTVVQVPTPTPPVRSLSDNK